MSSIEDQLVDNFVIDESTDIFSGSNSVPEMGFEDPFEDFVGTTKGLPQQEKDRLDSVHNVLLAAGFAPGIGNAADVADAIIYAFEGEFGNAGLSMMSSLPILGVTSSAYRKSKALARQVVEKVEERAGGVLFKRIPEANFKEISDAKRWVQEHYSSKESYLQFKNQYGIKNIDDDVLYPIYKKNIVENINDPVFRIAHSGQKGGKTTEWASEWTSYGGATGMMRANLPYKITPMKSYPPTKAETGHKFVERLADEGGGQRGIIDLDKLHFGEIGRGGTVSPLASVATHEITHAAQVGGAFTNKLTKTYDQMGNVVDIFQREPLLLRMGNELEKVNPNQFMKFADDLDASLIIAKDPMSIGKKASRFGGVKSKYITKERQEYLGSWWETSARVAEMRHAKSFGGNPFQMRAYRDLVSIYGSGYTKKLYESTW